MSQSPAVSDPRRATSARPACRVEWKGEQDARSEIIDRRSTIGSAWSCDVRLADPTVSRVHAELEPRDEGIWVQDHQSRNGTFLGQERIDARLVPYGVTVRFGATDVYLGAATEEASPVSTWPFESFGPLAGRSLVMRELFATLSRLAPLDCTIMVQGETGTGKELVAQAIHQESHRASGPLTVVDCGSLSETLIEAELFGHTKGAFTGAERSRVGAIEAAENGTLFLDEIGELPMSMQPKLLRVLESSTVRRIGESKHRDINVRFISATHRDLRGMVDRGEFREDLYFRLAVVPVRVPPLRERPEDIELLLEHFLAGPAPWLTPAILSKLQSRRWRGNVRELRNLATRVQATKDFRGILQNIAETNERAAPKASPQPDRPTMAPTAREASPLPPKNPPALVASPPATSLMAPSALPTFVQSLRAFRGAWMIYGERAFLRALRERHADDVAAAAKEAGIDRTHLYRLLRKHSM